MQENAREAAVLEEERIQERALELKRLQEDQRERARLRHNEALKKELLKHVCTISVGFFVVVGGGGAYFGTLLNHDYSRTRTFMDFIGQLNLDFECR